MIADAMQLELKESWQLATNGPGLTDHFYDRLFSAAPEVRPLFPENMETQKQKLADMLQQVVFGLSSINTIIIQLSALAERHHEYGAEAGHYPVVGESLLLAFRDQIGDRFTEDHAEAWTEALELISAVMIQHTATKG